MSFAPESESPAPQVLAKPEALFRVPVGLASPLWGLFAGAAMTGATWWWMTRWARPRNLEAMFGAAEAVFEPEVAVLAAPVAETIEAVVESTPEPLVESMVEATPEPVTEALAQMTPEPIVEPLVEGSAELEALAPQVIEPAEIAPVEVSAEPAPTPKPKKKAAASQTAPKAD